jgi:hypothetical protein
MSSIPLDLERRFEQRWAARFLRRTPEPPPEKGEYEKQDQSPACPAKAKRKPADLSRAGDAGP